MKQTQQQRKGKIPVAIITGFLGSGKTTLVNHILNNSKGLRAAVIVNEFGEIGIDNQLIVSTKETIIELSNGCICCQVRGDIIETILNILKKHKKINYLIIETSGVANPVPVAQTFFLQELAPYTELDAIVTLIDTFHFKENLEKGNAKDQIKAADIIIMNKIDTITTKQKESIKKEINMLAPHARIIEAIQGNVKLELLLNINTFDSKRFLDKKGNWLVEDHPHDEFGNHIESDGITSFMFKTDKAMDVEKFKSFVQQMPEQIIRSKGIINFKGIANKAVYQHVGRRIDVKTAELWRKEKPKTELVFIGMQFDHNEVEQQLKQCVSNGE